MGERVFSTGLGVNNLGAEPAGDVLSLGHPSVSR